MWIRSLWIGSKWAKINFAIAMLVGIMTAYTSYSTRDSSTDNARNQLESVFEYARINQGSSEGKAFLTLYKSSRAQPVSEEIELLYKSAVLSLSTSGEASFIKWPPGSEPSAQYLLNVGQMTTTLLQFTEQPIRAGTYIGIITLVIAYILGLMIKLLRKLFLITIMSIKSGFKGPT